MIRIAAYSFSAIALLAVAFHCALALGMPWAELSWGGMYRGQLPAPMRLASVASALVLVILAIVVMVRAGYYLLYVSRRIPRWLSFWGFIGAPLMLAAGFSLAVTGDSNSTVSSIMYAPLGLQEMVLAVWLLARGFNPPEVTRA